MPFWITQVAEKNILNNVLKRSFFPRTKEGLNFPSPDQMLLFCNHWDSSWGENGVDADTSEEMGRGDPEKEGKLLQG